MEKAFLLVWIFTNVVVGLTLANSCCQKGIVESRSGNLDCTPKSGQLTNEQKKDLSCGLMFKACCENAVNTRHCQMGMTFARTGMMCTLNHAIAIQCCQSCKEGTSNKKDCDGHNGNVYAKESFKQCCLSGKRKKSKENLKAKEEEEEDNKKKKENKDEKEKDKKLDTEKDKKQKEKEKEKEKCSCDSKSSTGCKQTDKGPQCICKQGFELKNDGSCQDINECEVKGKNFCDRNNWCWNEVGYYRCLYECQSPRYRQHVINNRYVCKDVNECAEGSDNCNKETHTCINQIGGYKCKRVACKKGYKLVGENCEEIDACKASPCETGDYCYNVYGKAYCIKQGCPNVRYYEQRLASGDSIKECAKTKCDRLSGKENERCWKTEQFPSLIKRYAYKFDKKLDYDMFKFNYWWSFDRNQYNVDIRISDGNVGNAFYVDLKGDNKLNIINHKSLQGPRNLEFTMQMDVTSRRYGNLVWRYHYKFYVYIS